MPIKLLDSFLCPIVRSGKSKMDMFMNASFNRTFVEQAAFFYGYYFYFSQPCGLRGSL